VSMAHGWAWAGCVNSAMIAIIDERMELRMGKEWKLLGRGHNSSWKSSTAR
jgi:hypothetical protein